MVGSALWFGSFMSLLTVAVFVDVASCAPATDGCTRQVAREAVSKPYAEVKVSLRFQSTMTVLLAELVLLGARSVPPFAFRTLTNVEPSICIFVCCRIFLRRGLSNDSGFLASATQDGLPQSATMPKSNPTKLWHSVLAQSSFSICFTECCMLFAMLLCQGFDLLDP